MCTLRLVLRIPRYLASTLGILRLRPLFEVEFSEFFERIELRIRRILSFWIRDPSPLIRRSRSFQESNSRNSWGV